MGGITEFTYDANSNLLSVKDARNNVTSYTYDNMNRLTSRTDPLQRVETYVYDLVGNLKTFTDRRGKVTSYIYDNLYRMTLIGFGTTGAPGNPSYESTITYTYDTAGRLTQVTDSASGSMTYAYDNFNRVTSKTTPQGMIGYTFDAAGRRTSMTVAGQPAVNYSYDNANRLIQITQSTSSVSFAYDGASRLTSISHSNGIIVEYGYDQASNLTSIVYKKNATVLGNLTYEYDSVGKRTRMGGSFARTGLPQTLAATTYNGANQLTQRAAANLNYDNNGNLTSDGTNTYIWNARNQLVSMSGPGLTASFQYDASGQRINKTLNGVSTSYLSDGANAVQELSGATPTANMLTGGVDQVLLRNDATGVKTPLTDGLGSTLGLADDAGTLQTQYTYDPFGNTTSTGTPSTNSSKYTGREEDGTGLYYYRARYYSPSLQRFISEDPIGFGGGDVNFYAYVGNDPINSVDPSGLCGVFVLQDTTQYGEPTNDCLVFAAMVDIFASESSTDSGFVNTVFDAFKDRNDNFSARGFKYDFVDRTGESPNQVRHAAGAIAFGYAGGLAAQLLPRYAWGDAGRRTIETFNLRERSYRYSVSPLGGVRRTLLPTTQGQQADINLNGVAVPIGFLLGLGIINRNQVGNFIRRNICN